MKKNKLKFKIKPKLKRRITKKEIKNRIAKINIRDKKREITITLVIIMVLILFFTGYSFGKGFSDTTVNTNAEIATPILIVDNNPSVDITAINSNGYYDFKIKNYDETGKINQVNLKYNIEIISNIDPTISFKLLKDDKEIEMTNLKTNDIMLEKGEMQDNNYKLHITYDKSKSNSIEDIIQNVQIKVHSEQVKN